MDVKMAGLRFCQTSAIPALQAQLPSNNRSEISSSNFSPRAKRTQADCRSVSSQCRDWSLHLSSRKSFGKLGRIGRRIVACAAGISGESGDRLSGLSNGGVFWQPWFWSNARDVETQSLDVEFGGGRNGGGYGNGGQGGGGGNSGSDGSGSEGIRCETVFRRQESEDEELASGACADEECACRDAAVMRSRCSLLASLSSGTGDSSGGVAIPSFNLFGSSLFGKRKKPEEKAATAQSKPSGSQGGSNGQLSGTGNTKDAVVELSTVHKDGEDATAKRSETAALRRLQRETFEDLIRVTERLDKLEFHTGLRKSRGQSSLGEGAAKTRLKGEVCAGGAFLLLDDESSRYARAALEQAGLHTGMDARFTFETLYRERDVMITECSAGHSGGDGSVLGGPISVTKLVYNAHVTDDFNVVVAPLGARVSDITETVNPLQGQALTQIARVGPSLYQHCVGSAVGATLKGKTALISLSQYLSGWEIGSSFADAPLCVSTLAHVLFQPWENSVFSLSAVNRFWPSPPLPSVPGLHWSEMGPLILSKTRRTHNSGSASPLMSTSPRALRASMDNSSQRDFRSSSFGTRSNNASWGTSYGEAEQASLSAPEAHGSAKQSIALAGEIDVGANVSLAGWAQVDREYWFGESEAKEIEWGVNLAKTVGKTVDWGLCVGSSKMNLWSASRSEEKSFLGTGDSSGDMQLHMEAFMKLSMGRGFTLQPGLVYLLNKQSQTPALMLRSSWAL